jgi:hypothetical protein
MALIDDAGRYNRAAVMREAYRLFRVRRGREDWTFSHAMRLAWGRAREARDIRLAELAAFSRLRWAA